LVKKRFDVHGRRKLGELRGRSGGKQKNPGFYRIRIVMYLHAFRKTRITDFRKKGEYGIIMNKTDLLILLGKMIDEKWIKRTISEDAQNVKKYSLDKKGQEMVEFIHHLRDTEPNHPIFECESFIGIKSLG